eukprot:Nitzschia sp. Nitz4//scaffold52_size167869//19543//20776//NITZ4_002259-RA/size167869-snap-gene-0.209-mRNA-1//1//CDS//3329553984//357//frame0
METSMQPTDIPNNHDAMMLEEQEQDSTKEQEDTFGDEENLKTWNPPSNGASVVDPSSMTETAAPGLLEEATLQSHLESSEGEYTTRNTTQTNPSVDDDGEALLPPTKKQRTDSNDKDHDERPLEEKETDCPPTQDEETPDKTDNSDDALPSLEALKDMAESLIEQGTAALQELEQTQQQLALTQEEVTGKDQEIGRLQASLQKAQQTIAKLLSTVDTSNQGRREEASSQLVVAKLRADLLHCTEQRDEARHDLAMSKRRLELLQEDLRASKTKYTRLTNTHAQLERDHRSTQAMVASLQSNKSSANLEYHQRKVKELQVHIQGLSTVLTEKNRKIEELHRQQERSVSQNRLAQIRKQHAASMHSFK